jgi:hypothetical protein
LTAKGEGGYPKARIIRMRRVPRREWKGPARGSK